MGGCQGAVILMASRPKPTLGQTSSNEISLLATPAVLIALIENLVAHSCVTHVAIIALDHHR